MFYDSYHKTSMTNSHRVSQKISEIYTRKKQRKKKEKAYSKKEAMVFSSKVFTATIQLQLWKELCSKEHIEK